MNDMDILEIKYLLASLVNAGFPRAALQRAKQFAKEDLEPSTPELAPLLETVPTPQDTSTPSKSEPEVEKTETISTPRRGRKRGRK